MTKRIWELDAFRGLCILGMVIVHFIYDLAPQDPSALYLLMLDWGGVLFVLLSGICATLGSKSLRRGAIVFGCGILVSAVTYGMYRLGLADQGIVIYFGILHCLGVCMMLWPLLRKLSAPVLAATAIPAVMLGLWMDGLPGVETLWLMPLGLPWQGFRSSDYFPLLPYLGWFLLGAAIGKTLYRRKVSLFPGVDADKPVPAFLRLCGRHSLVIYLLHQPILLAVISLFGGAL